MEKSTISVWTIIAFLIGTLVGTGSLWEWKKSKIEAQGAEIDKVVKTTDLREKEIDQYVKILALTNEYVNDLNQYSKTPNPDLNNKIVQMRSQLNFMKSNFTILENELAGLEDRQPRNIPIDFIPPAPPTGLTATVQ